MLRLKPYEHKVGLVLQDLRSQSANTVAVAQLAGIAGLSALLYWLAFVDPYSLFDLYQRPRLELYQLSKDNPMARWLLVIAFLAQGALYWLGWRLAQRTQGRTAWIVVVGGALIFGTILLFMYPLDAADIFDNIMHGRILGVYRANPFRQVAAQFSNDPFYRYMAWRRTPSAYGPAWETLAALTARVAGNGIIANVVAFKLLTGTFLAASVGVVAAILRRIAPRRALAGVLWLAWNPVILYETLGNGHNDIVMVFWMLAAAWALLRRRYTLAILFLLVGALVKFMPLLLLPAAGLVALRDLPGTRARLRFLVMAGVSALVLVALAYGPFWYGIETLGIHRRTRLFTASLPAVGYALLQPRVGTYRAASAVGIVAASLAALFAFWQGGRAWRDRSRLSFVQATFNILMFYLLLTCLWFQQWYAVWPLAIAALLPPGQAIYLAMIFGYAALLSKHLVFGPMLFWIRPLPPKSWLELRFGPAVLGVPWLYALFVLWQSRGVKRRYEEQLPMTVHFSDPDSQATTSKLANALLVVAKRPAPGQTKTRLVPPLSPEHAAALYECFLRDTLDLMRQVPDVRPVVTYLPAEAQAYFVELAPDFEQIEQEGLDLGARLDNALTHYLHLGYQRVVIMNSDGPTLPVAYLTAAFETLANEVDVVLGPCDDGGYYLIGLKRPAPRLLREVRMSTPNVVADTLSLAAEEGLRVKLLPVWYDVDDATSLGRLAVELTSTPPGFARYTRAFLEQHQELIASIPVARHPQGDQ